LLKKKQTCLRQTALGTMAPLTSVSVWTLDLFHITAQKSERVWRADQFQNVKLKHYSWNVLWCSCGPKFQNV